jgi:hypothetical protein
MVVFISTPAFLSDSINLSFTHTSQTVFTQKDAQVASTNDFADSRGDRNLRVDRIIITYPNGTKTTY